MRGTLYKALGFFVWKTVIFYVSQKLSGRAKLALGGAVVVALALVLGAGARRQLGSGTPEA